MKETLQRYASMNAEKPDVYSSCCEKIIGAAASIDVKTDIQSWVADNRTGVSVPADIPYSTYDSEQPSVPGAKPKPAKPLSASASVGKIGQYKGPSGGDILNKVHTALDRVCTNNNNNNECI